MIEVAHHTPGRVARTRLSGPHDKLDKLESHLRRSKHVRSLHRTPNSLIVYHESSLGELVTHIEAASIAEVLHLPPGSDEALGRLGPAVLSAALLAIWLLL